MASADQTAVHDVLPIQDHVVPLDGADVLQQRAVKSAVARLSEVPAAIISVFLTSGGVCLNLTGAQQSLACNILRFVK